MVARNFLEEDANIFFHVKGCKYILVDKHESELPDSIKQPIIYDDENFSVSKI
jgi:hypothetical protein